jgi:NTE family protein
MAEAFDIREFLKTTPVFAECSPEEIDMVAPLFRNEQYLAGEYILREGGTSQAIYLLRNGRLTVKKLREHGREVVAHLDPPAVVGELSFLTGSPCVADVEVEVDAEILCLPKEDVDKLPARRESILRGLNRVLAERLRNTVMGGAKTVELPTVLLQSHPAWPARHAFPRALATSLGAQTGRPTLLVAIGADGDGSIEPISDGVGLCKLGVPRPDDCRKLLADQITGWKKSWQNLILHPEGPGADGIRAAAAEFSNFHGHLLGPGDPLPVPLEKASEEDARPFAVQCASAPTLPYLDGAHQLIWDARGADRGQASAKYQRTVDSIARLLGGIQIGLALGGGAAWGWAHIGVLAVLEKAGIPVDVMSGCSMGSLIGAFRAAGFSVADLTQLADYWRTRTRRFIEWRIWRMCLVNERLALRTFASYLHDRPVNQTETPYWANAVDIRRGREYAIRDGTLVDAIRASIALPGLLPPHSRDSHLLVDAGIMDPVPVKLAKRMGANYAIAVNAMAPVGESEVAKSYPFNLFDVMLRCMFVMGHEIGQARAESSADVLLTLPMKGITMLDFARSNEIVERGRLSAEERLADIRGGYLLLKTRLHGKR